MKDFAIITFYDFRPLDDLPALRGEILDAMRAHSILGTMIIASEGFNSTVSGAPDDIGRFVREAERIFACEITFKMSRHTTNPFRRRFVKIKREIVTLRRAVDLELGRGTHVGPREWNELITRPDVLVLDTRNDYEVRVGSFRGAVNPETASFSELPDFVAENLDPERVRTVAMYCTGGIRCEKFAPYVKGLGFENVFQLEGGILRYLEETPPEESLWEGECFVFDDRISVDRNLRKGKAEDLSAELKSK